MAAGTYSLSASLTLVPNSGTSPIKLTSSLTSVARVAEGATAGQAVATAGSAAKTQFDLGVLSDGRLWFSCTASAANIDNVLLWRDVAGTKTQWGELPPGATVSLLVPSVPYHSSANTAGQLVDYLIGQV